MDGEKTENESHFQPQSLNSIQTFQSDVAETIKKNDISVINIAVSEQKNKHLTTVDVKKNVFLLPVIIISNHCSGSA